MKRTMTRITASISVLAAALTFGGCWGRSFWNAQEASLSTEAKVDSLLKENDLLNRRIYHLETLLEGQQEQLRRSGARTSVDLEEIKDQINAILDAMGEERRSSVHTSVRHPSSQTVPAVTDTTSPPDTVTAGGEADTMAGEAGSVPMPEEMYRQIYLDFSRMEYEIALEESEVFLREYPGDPRTEEVRFIRGECYLGLGQDHDALKEFSVILQDYPRGQKVPAVLLRMAITYEKAGDMELARGVAGRLIREYPDTGEAVEARERFGESPDDQ